MVKRKRASQRDMDEIAILNSERFTAFDLIDIWSKYGKLPKQDRGFDGIAVMLVKYFSGQPDRVHAAICRLTAMSEIVESGALPIGVTPENPDGSRMAAECVFEAAAVEPMLFYEGKLRFHPESFLKRVMELYKVEGNA